MFRNVSELLNACPGAAELLSAPKSDESEKSVEKFVAPFVDIVGWKFIALIPVLVQSEANIGGKLRSKIARKVSVKRAVQSVLGPNLEKLVPFAWSYHEGHALRIVYTRLGGRGLDAFDNLPRSLKGVQDVLAGALMADDRDPRWQARAEQEPGGLVGVRIEIEVL